MPEPGKCGNSTFGQIGGANVVTRILPFTATPLPQGLDRTLVRPSRSPFRSGRVVVRIVFIDDRLGKCGSER